MAAVKTGPFGVQRGRPDQAPRCKVFRWRTANRAYDVAPDRQRFLMIKDGTAGQGQNAPPGSMVVVLN